MALDTDLNVSPYYDDYNEEKNYHRILFRPAVPIQARELTQLQSILQNQVERFGDNIYRQGTILKGCNLSFDFNFTYVKILDLQVDGITTLVSRYANTYVKDSANLTSEVINQVQGLESQNPNLSTLFLKYINTGTGSKKKYANSDVLTIYAKDYSLQSITISAAGTLYDNTDTVVITGGSGSGANASIVTFSNGSIKDVIINSGGSGYLTAPTINITSATGSSGALVGLNYIAQVRVANSSFTAPVGTGSAVTIGDGIIYQKGHFIRVEEQTTIISKYSNKPSNVSLGFVTSENIVNNSVDSTLLDNAQGYSNYTAPGSHRLKLTPTFVAIPSSEAQSNLEFFSILEFDEGVITKRRTATEFNSVSSELAKRTREESGDYVVKPFSIYTEEKTGNTTHLNLSVSAGVGYVNGFRTEISGTVRVPFRKGTDTSTSNNQTISTNYGNYVVVNELLGNFDFSTGSTVNLRNTAATDCTDNFGGSPTSPGSIIGTAKLRSVLYESGDIGTPSCKYRLYLFAIKMTPGQTFAGVRSVNISGGGTADVVLTEGKAVLKETDNDSLIFTSGANAVSFFTNEQFVYRRVDNVTIQTTGIGTLSVTGSEEFPYTVSSTLNDTQEQDFIVIPQANAFSTVNLTGTVSTSGNVVTGTSTNFLSELDVGDYIKLSGNDDFFRVSTLVSATSMTLNGTSVPTVSSNTFSYAFPKNVPVRLNRGSANVSIDSNGNTAFLFVGTTLDSSMTSSVYYNSKVDGASAKTKTVVKDVYVKLSTDKLASTTVGPWCIGIPDAFRITGVFVGSSNTYSNTTTNFASSFELITGQTDNVYGLSFIKRKPGSTVSLSATNNLLVRVDIFTHGSGYYLSTESYPVDDSTEPVPNNKIRTESIPYFLSPRNNKYFNLRDCIDFRPIVANTANTSATSVAGATVDPSSTETLTGTLYFPTPNEAFEADVTHFLSRVDAVVMDAYGTVSIVEGKPDLTPVPPKATDSTMKLGTIVVPPYPTLSPKAASLSKRFEYSTLVKTDQTRGYTMKDIKQIEDRINRIEYYSLLNTLERSATDINLPSEANTTISRFKNGFFADSFSSYDISNVSDPEYLIYIDTKSSTARPQIEKNRVELIANTSLSSNVTFKGEYALLNYNEVEFINQPIANKTRNPVQLYWNFKGQAKLFPKYDDYYDVQKGSVNVTIDLATPLNQLTQAINDNVQFKKDSKQITTTDTGFQNTVPPTRSSTGVDQRTVTQTTTTVGNSLQPGDTITNVQPVGEFLTDFGMKPYIRAQWITVVAVGLRPDAEHFVFFDKVNMAQYLRPATVEDLETMDTRGLAFEPTAKFTGPTGSTITTDSNGTLIAAMYIPAETFFVGERSVIIADNSDIDDLDSSISAASTSYNAYNFYKDTSALTITTKSPGPVKAVSNTTVDVKKTTTTRLVPQLPTPAPSCCCFVRGTQITMADGTYKKIEDVLIGDYLLGQDGAHNKVVEFLRPTLGDTGSSLMAFNGGNPFMTSDHPVYIRGKGWKSFDPEMTVTKYNMVVGKYNIGDVIETQDGVGFEITSIQEYLSENQDQVIYNFRLDGNHTYIADNLIVHNKDPIAQTFLVNPTSGADGVFVTKSHLFFRSKDETGGMTVQIRDTDNGYPAPVILGEKFLKNSSIAVSNNASEPTVVTFDTPIYLKAGREYAIVSIPDRSSPEFKMWVGEIGVPDVANSSLVSAINLISGSMFLSQNDTTWTPYQSEDLKFKIFIADFNKTSGTVVLENTPTEFLTLSNTNGSFIESEEIAQKANTYLSGTFTCNTSSAIVNTSTSQTGSLSVGQYVLLTFANTAVARTGTVSNTTAVILTGTSTLFTTEYAAGDYLLINSEIRQIESIANNTQLTLDAPLGSSVSANAHFGISEKFQVSRVNAANTTTITLKDIPKHIMDGGTTNYGSVQRVVRAVVEKINNDDTIVLKDSTASNSTFRFEATKLLVGEDSQATATISSVDNKSVNFTESYLRYITPPSTSTTIVQKILANTGSTAANSVVQEGVSNHIRYDAQIKSRSNEVLTGEKSIKVFADLTRANTFSTMSPVIDTVPASIVLLENVINNSNADETTRYGNSQVRYISKNVVLADGLDAEDIKVYITAYKPSTSEIYVYAKILSSDDDTKFDDRDWTLLKQISPAGTYSDSLNEKSFIELEYTFEQTPPSTRISGIITSNSNTTISGVGTTFTSSLSAGDIVKIVESNTLTDYDISVVDTIANNTSLALKTSTSFSGSGTLEKVTQPGAAFKYNRDDNIVNYFNPDKSLNSTYKTFAIKVVLTSSSKRNVPLLKDIRALAVSV